MEKTKYSTEIDNQETLSVGQKYICVNEFEAPFKSNNHVMKINLKPSNKIEFIVKEVKVQIITLKSLDSKLSDSTIIVTRTQLQNNFKLTINNTDKASDAHRRKA